MEQQLAEAYDALAKVTLRWKHAKSDAERQVADSMYSTAMNYLEQVQKSVDENTRNRVHEERRGYWLKKGIKL